MALRDIINKVKGLAGKNPEAVRRAIDTVQDQVDRRTGGKHRQHVEKAGDALETQLGVRQTQDRDPQQHRDPRQDRRDPVSGTDRVPPRAEGPAGEPRGGADR